jgi:hypothetical protein
MAGMILAGWADPLLRSSMEASVYMPVRLGYLYTPVSSLKGRLAVRLPMVRFGLTDACEYSLITQYEWVL